MKDELPRGAIVLLKALPRDLRETVAGDLEEEYVAKRSRTSRLRADAWLWWTAAKLATTFRWERATRVRGVPPIGDALRSRTNVWDSLRQDVSFSLRMLRRQPGFTAVALVALALGIGANATIFSVVDAVLWRPLPFAAGESIVSVAEQRPREGRFNGPVAPDDFIDWRHDSRSFLAMSAYWSPMANLSGGGEPERLRALVASPGFLHVVGAAPALGRDFRTEEETPGRDRVVLLTDGFWKRRFGADRSVIGTTITLNGNPHEIVGVLPSGFWWSSQPDVLLPLALEPPGSGRALHGLEVVARLKPGTSIDEARAEMDAIGRRLAEQFPRENTGHAPNVTWMRERMVGDFHDALLVLFAAVCVVLLIACANVATLLLARANARQKEMAIRMAVGAWRGRLVRQLLTESLLLAAAGGAAGLLLASWGVGALRAILPAQFSALPGIVRLGIDVRVLTAAAVLSLATGVVFGLMPALAASHRRVGAALNESGRSGGSGVRTGRMRAALIVAEMALSVVLLVGAGLLLVSFKRLVDVSPGFRPQRLIAASLSLPGNRYGNRARILTFYESLLARLRGAPGIDEVAAVSHLPFSGQDARTGFSIEGRTAQQSPIPVRAHPRLVTPGYLSVMGIPLIRGRFFTDHDAEGTPPVIIINQATARRFWPDEDPIGKRMGFNIGPEPRLREIVGIVGDIKHAGLDADANPEAYLPYLQPQFFEPSTMNIVVRTSADVAATASAVRSAVRELDKDQPVGAVRAVDDLIAGSVGPRRLNLVLIGGFALVAVALTAFGLYGVMAYVVARRTHEIGVRMALGASPAAVLALMFRQAGAIVILGIGIGLLGALALTRSLTSLLFGVSAADPAIYAAVCGLLALVALVAIAVPSSRATRVDPLNALRS